MDIICEWGNTQYNVHDLKNLETQTLNGKLGLKDLRTLLYEANKHNLKTNGYGPLTEKVYEDIDESIKIIDNILKGKL